MHLYACELDHQEDELVAAKKENKILRRASLASTEEIKILRRASLDSSRRASTGSTARPSTASTTTTRTGESSTPDSSQVDNQIDANDELVAELEAMMEDDNAPGQQPAIKVVTASEPERPESNTKSDGQSQRSARRHPTSQRSSSLEVVSSWWDLGTVWQNAEVHPQQSDVRTASPRRQHPTARRSNSLEAASSWWKPAWKAVRNGARQASETAKETARILADEARILADEARDVLAVESRSQDTSSGTAAPLAKSVAKELETEYIEWLVDFKDDAGMTGLKLEALAAGQQLRRVQAVAHGFALDIWNASKVPVTVFLYPGRRERVMRRIVVQAGDEVVSIDGHALELGAEEPELCRTITFRRKIPQRRLPTGT